MKAKAYVDGSYNANTRVYGAGAVLFLGEDVYKRQDWGALATGEVTS